MNCNSAKNGNNLKCTRQPSGLTKITYLQQGQNQPPTTSTKTKASINLYKVLKVSVEREREEEEDAKEKDIKYLKSYATKRLAPEST